jgi:hypothetical protein
MVGSVITDTLFASRIIIQMLRVGFTTAYTAEQQAYLDDITNADLAASVYLSATDYLTIADGQAESMAF